MTTELHLINWRSGNTQAERLGAKILIMEGYESVDPQCPLGGPDGLKDIVCEKNGWKYIAACYFGIDQKEFKEIKEKFEHDLEGVTKNNANGIVFITNQHITPTERQGLEKLAEDDRKTAIIYHKERIVAILNSPLGYGIRLELFGIEMNKEEQMSFFSQQNNYLKKLLDQQSDFLIKEISKRIDGVQKPIRRIEKLSYENRERTRNIEELIKDGAISSDKTKIPASSELDSTLNLNLERLLSIHKLLLFSDSIHGLGELRKVQVWIASTKSGNIEDATYVPPPADEVLTKTELLLSAWRDNYETVKNGNLADKLKAITEFHFGFLSIHPFLDGNGRVARYLLNQQASELLGIDYQIILKDTQAYYLAINDGHNGNLEPLTKILTQAIYGKETI